MKNISIKINGEFSDSFIYSGVLFLVGFDASLRMVHWDNLISDRLSKEQENVRLAYENIFLNSKKDYRKFGDLEKKEIEIDKIDNFIISERILSEWPTDINIFSNKLYFSSDGGLKLLEFNGKKRFHSDAYNYEEQTLFDDCKVFSFDIDNNRALLCSGLEGGLYSFLSENKLDILGDDKSNDWIDCSWHHDLQSNAVLDLKSKNESRVQKFKDINVIKERLNKISSGINEKKNTYNRHLLKIKNLRNRIEECARMDFSMNYKDFVSQETVSYFKVRISSLGIFKEIENKIHIENDKGKELVIYPDEDISNWRIFPKAKTHLNQLHLIDNENIKIIGFEL